MSICCRKNLGVSIYIGVFFIFSVACSKNQIPTDLIEELISKQVLEGGTLANLKVDGYKGIWFELGKSSPYGDKYSGGLGTYTANHRPLAVYCPEVQKTFFVYGGTTRSDKRHLLCMIGAYDHSNNTVSKPTIVFDKGQVDDPHDNASMLVDQKGFIWIFISGRSNIRNGYIYRSQRPYKIDHFDQVIGLNMTYPQAWQSADGSILLLYTKYENIRELYFRTFSDTHFNYSEEKLAAIRMPNEQSTGHYQISCLHGNKIGVFFNRTPQGNVDKRTDLYYIQTFDRGETWENIQGEKIHLPIVDSQTNSIVYNYTKENKNIYLNDINFDQHGFPICLYIKSGGAFPGPQNEPYEWVLTKWDGSKWFSSVLFCSDHNYDMGSLFINKNKWNIVAPSKEGNKPFTMGGELCIWESDDEGHTWAMKKQITNKSNYNHSYVRRVVNGKAPFNYFWVDGDPEEISNSNLYFGDIEGNVFQLPYKMKNEYQEPIRR